MRAGIARVTGVSEQWLQTYVNAKYSSVSKAVEVWPKKKGRLTIQCDEMWSFVGNKGNKQWEELALDVNSGEIVGVFVGDRGSCRSKRAVAVATGSVSAVCYMRSQTFGRRMSE